MNYFLGLSSETLSDDSDTSDFVCKSQQPHMQDDFLITFIIPKTPAATADTTATINAVNDIGSILY